MMMMMMMSLSSSLLLTVVGCFIYLFIINTINAQWGRDGGGTTPHMVIITGLINFSFLM
jgi:hypothetical protein